MKVDKFIQKWFNKEIENWGGQTSPSYNEFQKDYKSVLRDICKEIGFSLYKFLGNHYCFCAVLKNDSNGKYYYVSVADVRYWNKDWLNSILYRGMKHSADWSGDFNNYSTLEDLADKLVKLDKYYDKQYVYAQNYQKTTGNGQYI